jgi:hypothetical protein
MPRPAALVHGRQNNIQAIRLSGALPANRIRHDVNDSCGRWWVLRWSGTFSNNPPAV